MEYWVDSREGVRESETECMGGDLLQNRKRSKLAMIKFLSRPGSPDVLGGEPDLVSDLQGRRGLSGLIGLSDLLGLGYPDLLGEIAVELGK